MRGTSVRVRKGGKGCKAIRLLHTYTAGNPPQLHKIVDITRNFKRVGTTKEMGKKAWLVTISRWRVPKRSVEPQKREGYLGYLVGSIRARSEKL